MAKTGAGVARKFAGKDGITVQKFVAALLKGLEGKTILPSDVLVISDGVDSIRPVRAMSLGHIVKADGGKHRFDAEEHKPHHPAGLLLR